MASPATELGLDRSGNGNNWTVAGTLGSDQMLDTPTNNFCTMNPLSYVGTLSEGNLAYLSPTSDSRTSASTMASSSGKWYAEVLIGSTGTNWIVGVASAKLNPLISGDKLHNYTGGNATYFHNGNKSLNGTQTSYGATYTAGDIIGIALDVDNGTVTFYKNNASQGSITLPSSEGTAWQFALGSGTAGSTHNYNINFGQDSSFAGNKTAQGNQDGNGIGDFFYTPPAGYLALCTSNLSEPAVVSSKTFNTVLYSGTGSSNSITGVGFQPDWIWIKGRDVSVNNFLFDAVRGVSKYLRSDITNAEGTSSGPRHLTAFGSDGFTVGVDNDVNNSGESFVSWNWNMGGTTASNTSGSITSSVRANPAAGQSIVTYTGTGSNATVGHGLTSAPGFIVVKTRNNTGDWMVYYGDNTDFLKLNEYNDTEDLAAVWNDTSPTSSVFTIGTNTDVNVDGRTYVAYCFSSIDGYSSVGTYDGNAGTNETDGTFVYTGFRPAWVMCKLTSADGESWLIKDNKRSPFNPADEWLYADKSSAEATGDTALRDIDLVSNGFKFRGWSTELNGNGESYTYLAFAETPFKYSNAR